MKIRVCRIEDGPACVEVIDPSDGAVANTKHVDAGEELTIVATTANSPADIEVGEVGPIVDSAPAEQVDTGEAFEDGGEDAAQVAQDTASTAEGAEETASGSGKGRGPVNGERGPDAA